MSTNLLSPALTATTVRRGSLQPPAVKRINNNNDRRLSAPSGELLLIQEQRRHSCNPVERLRNGVGLIKKANSFFKSKSWNSGDSISDNCGRTSSNGSPTSLKNISPLMSRAELGKFDFIIPQSPSCVQKQVSVHKETASLGSLDITQYLTQDEAQELKEVGAHVKLGEVKFCLSYNDEEEKIKVILKSVEVFLKPSPFVVGCNWACDPITYIDLLPDKRKPFEISYEGEYSIDVKKTEFSDKTLRLTIYDSRRKHVNIPIGHILLSLRDVNSPERMNIHSKKITFYSEPAGFNKGNLLISLSWVVSAQKLEIKIGKASNLKSPHCVEGKDHFVKMTTYVGGSKYKSFKTTTIKADPNLNFREKFSLSLTSPQLKDSSLVFNLYMKHTSKKMIVSKILTGKTIIGPYMKHGERCLSQWEKMITSPLEEITEEHILFL